ncbi:MAG: hypothetical protein V1807_01775 [Patescibacteria group bacterium]
MTRFFLSILAGLCLALTTSLGCNRGGGGPIIPQDLGIVEFISPANNDVFEVKDVVTARWKIKLLVQGIGIDHQNVFLVSSDKSKTSLPVSGNGNLVEDPKGFFTFFWETPNKSGTYHLLIEVFGKEGVKIVDGKSLEFEIVPSPPVYAGAVTVIDDDGILYANEPVSIQWLAVTDANWYKISYSGNQGVDWAPVGETDKLQIDWKIPTGVTNLCAKVEGYAKIPIYPSPPMSRAFSEILNITPFGEATNLEVLASPTIQQDIKTQIILTAKDEFGNTVTSYQSNFVEIWGEILKSNGDSEDMTIISFDGSQAFALMDGSYAFMYTGISWIDGIKKIEVYFYSTNLPYKDGKITYNIRSGFLEGYAESIIVE